MIKKFCLVCTFISHVLSVNGYFDVRPENTCIIKGEMLTLHCTVNGAGIEGTQQVWIEYYTDPLKPAVVADDDVILDDYKGEFNIEGIYNLALPAGKSGLKHGGKYCCESALMAGRPASYAEVIVLDSHPVFTPYGPSIPGNIILEGQPVRYTCEVTYKGRWQPVMSWTNKYGEILPHTDESTTDAIKTYITFTVQDSDHGQMYTCMTNFGEILDPPPITNEATNVPSYENRLTSEVLQVHYSPRITAIQDINGNILSDGANIYQGESIICISTSNPDVKSYIWINATDNKTLGINSELIMHKTWLGNITLTCVVKNSMGRNGDSIGEDNIEVEVIVVSYDSANTAAIVSGVLLFSIIGVLGLVYVIKHFHPLKVFPSNCSRQSESQEISKEEESCPNDKNGCNNTTSADF